MQKGSLNISGIGYGLALIYGLGLLFYLVIFISSILNPQSIQQVPFFREQYSSLDSLQLQTVIFLLLYGPQAIGFYQVAKRRDDGRRLIIAMNVVMCGYVALTFHGYSSVISLAASIVIIVFFLHPYVKNQFINSTASHDKTVLIIDDDMGLLKTMKNGLLKEGYSVLTANTGEKGIEIARTKRPSLIILDVILPKMKGREVCIKLKKEDKTKDIPVIFLTAKDSLDDIKAEMEIGAVSHITKPVHFPKLLMEIHRIFHKE